MEEHNKNNRDFKELLKSMETRKTADLDDFEREALEGFALLESKEQAEQVKSELDEKIYNKLFTQDENRKRPVAYWFAAAGLLLVIGLSVLFVTNTENLTGKKDVAQTISTEEKSTPVQLPPAAVTENVSPEKNVSPENTLTQETAKTYKNRNAQVPDEEVVTKTHDERSVAKNDVMDIVAPAEDANSPKPVISDVKAKEKEETVSLKDEEKAGTQNLNENNFAGSVYREEKKQESKSWNFKKSAGKKAAPSAAEKSAMPSSVSGNTMPANTSPATQTEGKAVGREDSDKSKLSEKGSKSTGEELCYYTGGNTALKDDLKKKFTALEIDKPFKATLFINEKKKVEKITFSESGSLSAKEKKKISAVLKDLSGFNFFIQPTEKSLHEYELNYIP